MEKEKFDLQNFPTSESANRMLGYVTDGFYDNSYVGKWIYQVIGEEWDSVKNMIDDLVCQLFIETATWGLSYHEIKWQLPVREDLPYDERRRRIYQKRNYKAPITPYRMEMYLEDETKTEIHVSDANDPGEYGFGDLHPNIFKVYLILGEESCNLHNVYAALNRLKQSHTTYIAEFRRNAHVNIHTVAAGGIGNTIKVKTRAISKILSVAKDKNTSVLFVNQNITVKADNSIKENEVYILNEDGSKERVFTENGAIVKISGRENN